MPACVDCLALRCEKCKIKIDGEFFGKLDDKPYCMDCTKLME